MYHYVHWMNYLCVLFCYSTFRKPQLYIFGRLASVTSKIVGVTQNDITHVYHYFHKEDLAMMLNNSDQTINFKGHELVYRIAKKQYSSYMVDDCDNIQDSSIWKRIHPGNATPLTGIKLLHFATRRSYWFSRYGDRVCKIPYSRYGDCECKVPYDIIITRYLQARRQFSKKKHKVNSVVYRVGCTQIYQKEINHMVIICCDGDDGTLGELPILGPTFQTKHFTPKDKSTPRGTRYSANMLQYLYRDHRHEKVTLSLYLPDDCQLSLSKKDYILNKVHHKTEWCHTIFKTPNFKGPGCPGIRKKKLDFYM